MTDRDELWRALRRMEARYHVPPGLDVPELTDRQKEACRAVLRYRQERDAGGPATTEITPRLIDEATAEMDPDLAAALEEL